MITLLHWWSMKIDFGGKSELDWCTDNYYNYGQPCPETNAWMGNVVGLLVGVALLVGTLWLLKASLDNLFLASHRHSSAYKNEFSRVRRDVLARDGYRCQQCGAGGKVHVHHIVERRNGGTNAMSNLVTLCPRHHGQIHGKRWS